MSSQKLYVASSAHNGLTKIGISKDPHVRMSGMNYRPVKLVHVEDVPAGLGPRNVERLAHSLASAFRHRFEQEWFEITPEQAIEVVQLAIFLAQNNHVISWSAKIQSAIATKGAIEELASREDKPNSVILGELLQEALTARSTA